jgi:hypothetical protein
MVLKAIDEILETTKKPLYLVTSAFIYIGYTVMFLGVSYISPDYIRTISNITYALIATLLMYKFSPLRQITAISDYDAKLIFISASFILFNLGVTEYALSFFHTMKNTFGLKQ